MNKTILMILVALVALTTFASADSDLYEITNVYVDGIEVSDGDVSGIELNEKIEIKVYLEGTGNSSTCPDGDVDDCSVEVKVKAWIGGYEYDDLEATTSSFDIEPGVNYRKTLSIDIPEDLNVDDNDYTLYVEVYDSEDEERESYDLYAERPSHSLNILDVIYDSTIEAGENFPIEVRIENLGEKKEEDIKVEVSLENLDSQTEYIEELSSNEVDNEDEESSDSAYFDLQTNDDTESGTYVLTVTVSYNRGHDSLEETYKVTVNGVKEDSETTKEAETTVSLSSTSIKGTQNKDSTFTLKFSNTGEESETYKVTINGISQWATSSTSPDSVTVSPGSTEKIEITLTPDSESSGDYDFSLQILDSNDKLIEDIAMTMDVSEDNNFFGDTTKMLKIGFILLIVLIILIGLIMAFRKMKDDDDDEEELEPKEGKTYY